MAKKIKYRTKRNWNAILSMEEQPKKIKRLDIPAGTPSYVVASSYANNKKHIIKGLGKSSLKRVKNFCSHNWYNPVKPGKPGKVMLITDPSNPDEAYCKMCGRSFRINSFSKGEIKEAMGVIRDAADQVAFIDGRKPPEDLGETSDYISNLRMNLKKFPKVYRNSIEVNKKMQNTKKKKKKKRKNGGGQSHGEWRLN